MKFYYSDFREEMGLTVSTFGEASPRRLVRIYSTDHDINMYLRPEHARKLAKELDRLSEKIEKEVKE